MDPQDRPGFLRIGFTTFSATSPQLYLDIDRTMAESLGVCATGGSDCHGAARDGMMLGKIQLPYERVEALKTLAKAKA